MLPEALQAAKIRGVMTTYGLTYAAVHRATLGSVPISRIKRFVKQSGRKPLTYNDVVEITKAVEFLVDTRKRALGDRR